METFYELNFNKGLSLAFGFFDGVHIGHKEVIKSAVDFAKKNGKKSAIITFQDHPCCYFYDLLPKYILRRHDKLKMFEELGVDYLYFLKFDKNLSSMLASDYLKDIIIKNFEPSAISTGFNHYFGAKKSGDVKYLNAMQNELQYQYFELPPTLYNEEVVSSTRIREDISIGNIEMVNAMLGYNYFLEETVVEGRHIGRTIGFKTANLLYPPNLVEIGNGVYQAKVDLNGEKFNAIANYGLRPTIDKNDKEVLEVHILDFDREIYGEKIRVEFIKKFRDEKKFDSLEELKTQIKLDIQAIG